MNQTKSQPVVGMAVRLPSATLHRLERVFRYHGNAERILGATTEAGLALAIVNDWLDRFEDEHAIDESDPHQCVGCGRDDDEGGCWCHGQPICEVLR